MVQLDTPVVPEPLRQRPAGFSISSADGGIASEAIHPVSSNPDDPRGSPLGAFIRCDWVLVVTMTGSCFCGDGEAELAPADGARFETPRFEAKLKG